MGARAGIADGDAPVRMLGLPDARIRDSAIRLSEVLERYPRQRAPKLVRVIDIEALVKVEAHPQALLIDLEEAPKPCEEKGHQARIRVGELHCPVSLGPFPGVVGGTGHQ